jgi:hypothetical protein
MTPVSPLIMCVSFLAIANPNPVPPYLRVVEASACSNAVKIFPD